MDEQNRTEQNENKMITASNLGPTNQFIELPDFFPKEKLWMGLS